MQLGKIVGEWLVISINHEQNGIKLEEFLQHTLKISSRMLQSLTRTDGLIRNNKKTHLQAVLSTGDRLKVRLFPKEEYGATPEFIPIKILFEDEHLLVVDKPAGLKVHPTEIGEGNTLANALAYYYQTKGLKIKVRHIHRLDQETSGVILVAKHRVAQAILDEKLAKREVQREYLAVVMGEFTEKKGIIDLPIGRDRHHPTKRRVSENGEKAITEYSVIEQYQEAALLRLSLKTGRTHQIRVHLSAINHPLLGDTLYGGIKKGIKRQALHAEKLTFNHPFTNELIEITAPIPADFLNLLETLKNN